MAADWDELWTLFHEALTLTKEDREAFVRAKAGEDAALRDEVLALLESHRDGDDATVMRRGIATLLRLDAESLIGQSVGQYRLTHVLGEGGMGVVYAAEQTEPIQRTVAIKLIRPGMDSREVIARFESERQALAMMNHPNVAQVIDAGATKLGLPYFVMELIEGEPVTNYCDARRLNTAERLELFLMVCAGVQHAHQKGIIHRDLKPTNVLVARKDGKPVPKIIDFGIAKATAQRAAEKTMFTQAGVLIGTPEYMSPEQAGLSELDVDTRTDVYSLGVLLFELLVGALPFEPSELRRAGYEEIRRRIREDEPATPSAKLTTLQAGVNDIAQNRRTDRSSLIRLLRGDLDWITIRALEKAPDRRYASPSELAADLRRHISDEPVLAGPPSVTYRIVKFARRHRLVVAATCVVTLSLLLGIAAATYGLLQAREAEKLARAEARTSEEVSDFLTGLFQASSPSARDVDSVSAREILDRGVERIRNELTEEPRVQSRLMQEMGKVYAQLGLLQEAQRLFDEALLSLRQLADVSNHQISESVVGLAGVAHLAGEHEKAIQLYGEAIQLLESDKKDPDVLWLANIYRSLGGVYETLARNAESLAALQNARALLESAHYSKHVEYARVLRNIGISHWSAQDLAAARTAYEESLRVYDQALDPSHSEISYVVNSLAILNYNLGEFDAARPMFERELANLERTLGHEHRNTASIMNNLGLLLLDMELLEEARPKIEESLRIREAVLGPEHEEVATSLCNLGRLFLAEQDPEAARHNLSRCLTIRENILGPNHPYVAGTLETYAEALHQLGEADDALAMQRRAKAIRDFNN